MIPALVKARPLIAAIADPLAKIKLAELDETIALCAGLWVEAQARQSDVAPGATLNHHDHACSIARPRRSRWKARAWKGSGIRTLPAKPATLGYNQSAEVAFNLTVPANQAYTQPYWLVKPATADVYQVDDQKLIGLPDTPPAAQVRVRLTVDGAPIELVRPVHHRYADRAQGERVRPLVVVPAVAVNLPEPVALFPDATARKVQVSVQANVANAAGRAAAGSAGGLEGRAGLADFRDCASPAKQQRDDVRGDAARGRNHGHPARRGQGERARYRVGTCR